MSFRLKATITGLINDFIRHISIQIAVIINQNLGNNRYFHEFANR